MILVEYNNNQILIKVILIKRKEIQVLIKQKSILLCYYLSVFNELDD